MGIRSLGNPVARYEAVWKRTGLGAVNAPYPGGGTWFGSRGLFSGGYTTAYVDTIDYTTISTTVDAVDFGNQQESVAMRAVVSNGARGLMAGGRGAAPLSPTYRNVIDYITFASTGDASDFGDILVGQEGPTGVSDGNRGVFAGGKAPTASDTIEFVAISVTGNATDFAGELTTEALQRKGGHSNGSRGVFTGGSPPTRDHIEYITIGTLGDSIDFGELFTAATNFASISDGSRAITGGSDPNTDTIQYLNMASSGNSVDFG